MLCTPSTSYVYRLVKAIIFFRVSHPISHLQKLLTPNRPFKLLQNLRITNRKSVKRRFQRWSTGLLCRYSRSTRPPSKFWPCLGLIPVSDGYKSRILEGFFSPYFVPRQLRVPVVFLRGSTDGAKSIFTPPTTTIAELRMVIAWRQCNFLPGHQHFMQWVHELDCE